MADKKKHSGGAASRARRPDPDPPARPLSARTRVSGATLESPHADEGIDLDPAPEHDAEFEALVRRELELLGEDPEREGLRRTPQRVANSLTLAHARLRHGRARRGGERGVQRDPQQHGDGARHRALLAVRAPHAPVLRPRAHRVHPGRKDRGALQAPAHRRDVRAPPPGAGAAHGADRAGRGGRARAKGRGRRDRGDAPVHDDARRAEAELADRHLRRARDLPRTTHARARSSSRSRTARNSLSR